MSNNKSINARQYEQIKEVTDQGCISMGEWVRDAVASALKTNQPKGHRSNEQ